jgi:hypothetical protein
MRRFFRFSVRDLLWLTLVVAMGLGWGIREWQLRDELKDARKWRPAAGAMEKALAFVGWKITALDFAASEVRLSGDGKSERLRIFGKGSMGESPFVHDETRTVPFSEPSAPGKD